MADEMKDIVKIAVDAHKGSIEKYSVAQSQEVLRNALIEANNGKTYLDPRDVRDGKCGKVFTLIEEILSNTIIEGLTTSDFFYSLVDFRNVAEGDSPVFLVEDKNMFVVADIADGTQGVRRQRLPGISETTIPTRLKAVRIYEELNRVLSGRVDFNDMISKVATSFEQQLLNDIYSLWTGATADQLGGITYYPTAGAYDEDELLELIAHVEAAASGQPSTIVCTKKAARVLAQSIMADSAREDLYNTGVYGKFYGTPVMITPQRHKIGSTEFVLDDNMLTIIAGDQKPIKCVYEGDPIVMMGDPTTNADLTQEYFYAVKFGMGIILSGDNTGIGRYEIA